MVTLEVLASDAAVVAVAAVAAVVAFSVAAVAAPAAVVVVADVCHSCQFADLLKLRLPLIALLESLYRWLCCYCLWHYFCSVLIFVALAEYSLQPVGASAIVETVGFIAVELEMTVVYSCQCDCSCCLYISSYLCC